MLRPLTQVPILGKPYHLPQLYGNLNYNPKPYGPYGPTGISNSVLWTLLGLPAGRFGRGSGACEAEDVRQAIRRCRPLPAASRFWGFLLRVLWGFYGLRGHLGLIRCIGLIDSIGFLGFQDLGFRVSCLFLSCQVFRAERPHKVSLFFHTANPCACAHWLEGSGREKRGMLAASG